MNRWLSGRCFAAAALVVAALGCGEGATGQGERPRPASQPLLLRAAPDASPPGEARVLAQLRVPPGIEPWTVVAHDARVGPPHGAGTGRHVADVLYLTGRGQKEVLIPGPFPAVEINQVVLTLRTQIHSRVRVELLSEGRTVVASPSERAWSSNDPQSVELDLTRPGPEVLPFDALRIVNNGNTGPFCLESVELVHRPLATWHGPPGGPPALAGPTGDQRRATVLTGETPLTVRFRAEAGSALAFSCSIPSRPRFSGLRPHLRIELAAEGGGSRSEEIALEAAQRGPWTWRDLRLPLDELAGSTIDARFVLEVDRPRDGPRSGGLAFLAEPRLVRETRDPSTVVLVTSDTHRADHLGAMLNGVEITTPVLDALARRGILFERCYSTTNITVPSHVSLLTGLHPRDTRVTDNVTGLASDATTLAETFAERGYRTFAVVSAYHLQDAPSGLGQGFDRFSAPTRTTRVALESRAVVERWLDEARGEALFLWAHFFDAHGPYEPPESFAAPYLARAPLGESTSPSELHRKRALYRGEVSYLDHQLGLLLEHPRLARAVLAVTADHGECLGQHDIYFEHEGLYTDTIHVPLLLDWPDAPAGMRISTPVQNSSVGRTLLDLAGLPGVAFPGRSLLEELEGRDAREPIFTLAFGGRSAGITHEGWHLIMHLHEHHRGSRPDDRLHARHEVELFHLVEDPGCSNDLVDEEPERARGLRRALIRWLETARPEGLARRQAIDSELRARLDGLGYAAEESPGSGLWFECDGECAWCRRFE